MVSTWSALCSAITGFEQRSPTSHPHIVIVASAARLPSLTARAAHASVRVVAFADTEARRAIAVIVEERPRTIALDQPFATTSRGVAMIRRITSDPALAHAEITIISADTDLSFLATPGQAAGKGNGSVAPLPKQRVTRRSSRFKFLCTVDVLVEGRPAALVNLSALGAQVVSPVVLRPNQRVRVSLADEPAPLRVQAAVVWAACEISRAHGPQYRAGLEFLNANRSVLEAYCARQLCRPAFDAR